MKTCSLCGLVCRVSAGLLATVVTATAQTTPSTTATPENSTDVIRLSEFDVSSSQARGYQAANSISATGIGVASYKVPLPIMVITSEFIKDTGAIDMRDAIQYTPGIVTDPRNEAAFTLRGFSGNIVYRNGFYRRQNYQTWDMARVEVIQGPAAIFFGSVRPGGIINYVTAKPDFKQTHTDVSVQAGSYSFYKGSLVHNQALTPNVALRFSIGGLESHGNGYQYDFLKEEHYAMVLAWKMGDRHQITLEADRERRNNYLNERGYALTHEGYLGNAAAIASGQSVSAWVAANYGPTAPVLTTFAPIYPANDPYGRKYAYNTDNFEKFDDWDVDLGYLFKINDHMVFETALSRGQDDQPGVRANNGNQTPFANGKVTMNFQYFENNRNSLVANNRLTIKFDFAGTKNTLQLGQQFQEVRTDQPGFTNAANSFSTNNLSAFITNFDPVNSAPLSNVLGLVFANQPINNWRHSVDITRGYYVALQSAFWKDRVHLLAGARYAVINGSIGYSVKPTNAAVVGRSTATTPQLGVIGEIIPGLSVYATYSRSIEPQNGSVDADGVAAGPIRSKGLDTGIKTNFIDGRFATTLNYFTLERTGIATTDTARQTATGRSPWFIFNTANKASGISFDANLAVTDNNSLIVGFQHMLKANITAAPPAAANTIGQPLADVPTNMFSLWNRYTFRNVDMLKGLSVGFGGRYSSSAAISSSPTTTVRNPSFVVLNAMASRSFDIFQRKVRVQANVSNLADKVYRDGANGMFGPPRKYFLTLDTRF